MRSRKTLIALLPAALLLMAAAPAAHAPEPQKPVDLDSLYVDWVRTKTEEICQFTLWPVTAEAIRRTIERRPKPVDNRAR